MASSKYDDIKRDKINLDHLDGFPAFAEFIGRDPDSTIFRRFDRLGARNLLYLQSNLNSLEKQLYMLDHEDRENGEKGQIEARVFAKNYKKLKERADKYKVSEKEADSAKQEKQDEIAKSAYERVSLHKEIQNAMKEYRDALIQEKEVRSFQKPPKHILSIFHGYFNPKNDPVLSGDDENLLDDPQDLLTLTSTEDDRLSRFLRYSCGYWLRDRERSRGSPIFYYSLSRVQLTAYIVTTIFSVILLLGAMLCLSLLSNKSWGIRLGSVAGFTALFAIIVGLLTNARRAEVFGSTAAYAAVLVVYVSGDLGNSTTGVGSSG